MTTRTQCPGCSQFFVFDTDRAPAQRVGSKGRRGAGRAVTFYPTCPHCREKVEVDNPVAPVVKKKRLPRPHTDRAPVGVTGAQNSR